MRPEHRLRRLTTELLITELLTIGWLAALRQDIRAGGAHLDRAESSNAQRDGKEQDGGQTPRLHLSTP
jgi:hypothetical protein